MRSSAGVLWAESDLCNPCACVLAALRYSLKSVVDGTRKEFLIFDFRSDDENFEKISDSVDVWASGKMVLIQQSCGVGDLRNVKSSSSRREERLTS